MRMISCVAVSAAFLAMALPVQAADKATADIKDASGKSLGVLELTETEDGVQIQGKLSGLEPGDHGFHIHETGKCEPPFKSAGGHYNPTNAKHGEVDGGSHAGDMKNITVAADGSADIDVTNELVTLKKDDETSVFDADGSAIVVHAKPDDYKSQPSGDAGDRVGCGVIQ